MKAKDRIAGGRVNGETPVVVPLEKDEVIDRLEKALEKVACLINAEVGDEIPILLFLAEASGEMCNGGVDHLTIKGMASPYCSPLNAIERLTSDMAARLHGILEEADAARMEASRMMDDYKKYNRTAV
jgi:hypothetical protein